MKRHEIETLARFAACLLANDDETESSTLSSFTDPEEVLEIAQRAWEEIEKYGGFVDDDPKTVDEMLDARDRDER